MLLYIADHQGKNKLTSISTVVPGEDLHFCCLVNNSVILPWSQHSQVYICQMSYHSIKPLHNAQHQDAIGRFLHEVKKEMLA
jgi:hypothetical protein